MKKLFLLWEIMAAFIPTAKADICYDVNHETSTKAVEILKSQKEIYKYCSICKDAAPQTIQINKITENEHIYVNDKALDLAHIYYKKGSKYINLGISSGCIKPGEYGISAELADLPVIHKTKESNKQQAKKQAQTIYEECSSRFRDKEAVSTADMVEQNINVNNCLADAVKKEIEQGFEPEQQTQMLEYLKEIRRGILGFYAGIYADNKYCYGSCDTITNLLPYGDEYNILIEMLENLLFLNIEKNGY